MNKIEYNVIFVGASGIGKTSLANKFSHGSFQPYYTSTIGIDRKIRDLVVDNKNVKVKMWDTAGQERFQSLVSQYFRDVDAVLCVYDVTSRESFQDLRNWITRARRLAPSHAQFFLIGNKIDLPGRRVFTEDLFDYMEECKYQHFETSAKQGNVEPVLEKIIRQLLKTYIPEPMSPPPPVMRNCCF